MIKKLGILIFSSLLSIIAVAQQPSLPTLCVRNQTNQSVIVHIVDHRSALKFHQTLGNQISCWPYSMLKDRPYFISVGRRLSSTHTGEQVLCPSRIIHTNSTLRIYRDSNRNIRCAFQ